MSKQERAPLHVLFISAEADPYVKIGGLGDVAGSLPTALRQIYSSADEGRNLDIRVVIPYYGLVQKKGIPVTPVTSLQISTDEGFVQADVLETRRDGLIIYFIAGKPIRPEDPVYGSTFAADTEKFIFFSLACLELPKAINWHVDILHAQDWHTAISVHQLKELKQQDAFYVNTSSVITLHNLPFMGAGADQALDKYKINPSTDPTLTDWGLYQPLPMGLSAADRIVAVSPTYAQEILTPQYGCDLHGFFKANRKKLSGILNGLDLKTWDPASDPCIPVNFNVASIQKRSRNKAALQKEIGWIENPEIPLFIVIGRMDPQKGMDLVVDALHSIKHIPWQAIILGSGNPQLEQYCQTLEKEDASRVRCLTDYNAELAHRMYAGGDMILMPSRYEPCGLAQMIAMHYGCIPVARATGGLKDTIIPQDDQKNGTGFLFENADAKSLAYSIAEAVTWFHDALEWRKMQERAMQIDFSWNRSAQEYAKLYNTLTNIVNY